MSSAALGTSIVREELYVSTSTAHVLPDTNQSLVIPNVPRLEVNLRHNIYLYNTKDYTNYQLSNTNYLCNTKCAKIGSVFGDTKCIKLEGEFKALNTKYAKI